MFKIFFHECVNTMLYSVEGQTAKLTDVSNTDFKNTSNTKVKSQ